MSLSPPGRVAALVGRPSVGKSALFNRLVGRRVAIVHEQPGVTRDRIASEAHWDDQRFELIDTGGIGVIDAADPSDAIAAGARRQVDLALHEAAVILMVVDVQAGVLPLDRVVARLLHRAGRPVLLAANKADNETLDLHAAEFAALGFPVFPVSALHARGFDALMGPVLAALPAPAPPVEVQPLRVAVVGRPNAGKSSYVNRLLNTDRVIVSDVPGTTRDSVEVPFRIGEGPQARHYVLIDTAGVRPHGKVHDAVEHFSVIRVRETIGRADLAVLVIDAVQGPSKQDKRIADLLIERRKACVLLVTKWDLAEGVKVRAYREALYREMPFLAHVPVVFASSSTGRNVRDTVETIDHVAAQWSAALPTGVLNRVLHGAFEAQQPPRVRDRRLKLFYAAQVGTRPPRVRLFVNDPARVAPAYRAFLERRLREAFGLEGSPVILQFSGRRAEPPA